MTPTWFTHPLDEGDEGDDVAIVQRKLGAPMSGVMDLTTMALIRGYQRAHGLEQTGMVDALTAEHLGEKASAGTPPRWFRGPLALGSQGLDVGALALTLGLPLTPTFDATLTVAVRRFQASVGLPKTGELDLETAIALADRTVE